MSNNTNRTLMVAFAASWIVLMAVVIFLAWSASGDAIEEVADLADYLGKHNDNAGKLIVTLGALVLVVLALLAELAPEDEERELKVKQAGATTIVPAAALRQRLEESLMGLPEVSAVRARVGSSDKGISTSVALTVVPAANIASVSREATRVVVDTMQTDLGLPLAGIPSVRVAFGGPKTAASSISHRPLHEPPPEKQEPDVSRVETVDERIETGSAAQPEPAATPARQAEEVSAGASPGPMVYEAAPPQAAPEPETSPERGPHEPEAAHPGPQEPAPQPESRQADREAPEGQTRPGWRRPDGEAPEDETAGEQIGEP